MNDRLMKRLQEAEDALRGMTAMLQGTTELLRQAQENTLFYMTRCQALEVELSEVKICLGYATACLYRAGFDDEKIKDTIRQISLEKAKEVQ